MNETEELKKRIAQLEDSMRNHNILIPPGPDPSLKDDEWYAIFPDWSNPMTGTITKIAWGGGSNKTAVFKVKRIE